MVISMFSFVFHALGRLSESAILILGSRFRPLLAFVFAAACLHTDQASAQNVAVQKLRVVGSVAGLNQYVRHEEPFWTKRCPN
jgi:hypothetical protein